MLGSELRLSCPGDEKVCIDAGPAFINAFKEIIKKAKEEEDEAIIFDIMDNIAFSLTIGQSPAEKLKAKMQVQSQTLFEKYGFHSYAKEYGKFFINFLQTTTPHFHDYFNQIKTENSNIEISEMRDILIKKLSSQSEVTRSIGEISDNPEYIFKPTPLSTHLSTLLLTEVFSNEGIVNDMIDDMGVNKGSRCLITLPCKISYSDKTNKHVLFVALSGHATKPDPAKPYAEIDSLYELHGNMKYCIDNLVLKHEELGEIECRYIEHATRKYDFLLKQATYAILEDCPEELLPQYPTKSCAEKKLLSELAKQHMHKTEQNIEAIQVLGETNISFLSPEDLQNPESKEELALRVLLKKEKGELARVKKDLQQFESKLKKLNENPKKSAKQIKDLEPKISKKTLELESIKEKIEIKKSKYQFTEVPEKLYIPSKADPSKFHPVKPIPACEECQKNKLAYLAVMMAAAETPLLEPGSKDKKRKRALTSAFNASPTKISPCRAVSLSANRSAKKPDCARGLTY